MIHVLSFTLLEMGTIQCIHMLYVCKKDSVFWVHLIYPPAKVKRKVVAKCGEPDDAGKFWNKARLSGEEAPGVTCDSALIRNGLSTGVKITLLLNFWNSNWIYLYFG